MGDVGVEAQAFVVQFLPFKPTTTAWLNIVRR
jgi:hypothetical protein